MDNINLTASGVSVDEIIRDIEPKLLELIKYHERLYNMFHPNWWSSEVFDSQKHSHFLWNYPIVIFYAVCYLEHSQEVFPGCWPPDEDVARGNQVLSIAVNLSDTFYYACADDENIPPMEFWKVFTRFVRGDEWAFVKWAENVRGVSPIEPIKKKMDKFYKKHPEMAKPMPYSVGDYPIIYCSGCQENLATTISRRSSLTENVEYVCEQCRLKPEYDI